MISPLDRIEAQVRETFMPSRPKLAADVLALVNVAKAAEGLMMALPDQGSSNYPEPGSPYGHLREALAALNKEPA